MIQKLVTKFKTLSPVLKGLLTLLSVLGVIGSGYVITGNTFFQTVINNNYNYPNEELKKPLSTSHNENDNSQTIENINKEAAKQKPQPTKTNNNPTKDSKPSSLFSGYPLKSASQTNISFFVIKNKTIDSKTTRRVSGLAKNLDLNVPLLFNKSSLTYFDDFLFPSKGFIEKHKLSNYLDYYFICDINHLDTKKKLNNGSYTSTLNIEGYLININNNQTKQFPYKNIKGFGFSENDANLNLSEDLETKIIKFVTSHLPVL